MRPLVTSLFLVQRRKKKVILLLLMLTLSFIPVSNASSSWMREGVYARYGNGSLSFKWECVQTDGAIAELQVDYSINGTIQRSALVYADIQTRDITLQNGTSLGKTALWLPPNPAQNETIELTENITGEIETSDGWVPTIQGPQKFFEVNTHAIYSTGFWDLDTGVILDGEISGEPISKAIGFSYFGFSLIETNIDLGPREWLPEIIMAMPYFLPVIAFLAIFVLLFRRRQRRKRQRELITQRKRKAPKADSSSVS